MNSKEIAALKAADELADEVLNWWSRQESLDSFPPVLAARNYYRVRNDMTAGKQ